MAPAKKNTNRRRKNAGVRNEKLVAFLKDFDSQVKTIVEQLKTTSSRMLKEIDGLYNLEIIKLPVSLREMNWLEYFAKGGREKALEEVVEADFDVEEIITKVSQTPFKAAKKVKETKNMEAVQEAVPTTDQTIQKTKTKAKPSAKKVPPPTRKARPCSINNSLNRSNKRSSRRNLVTPVSNRIADMSVSGPSRFITSINDSRLCKTPLRTPRPQEQVYSANGSPLADIQSVYLNVPVGDGEKMMLFPNQMDTEDLGNLNRDTIQSIQLLSNRLAKICRKIQNQS
ncbi:borealin isoform X2 [Rhinatrema bivittatum]|nr:borealin isoform X2 [Rhinatrema bivittatum]XP_029426759.1 borealin isoform X2 [Rhinatrema bivittatum]XP_029426760.1 borealin isoform X2 [Rhinatrema bivittatum]XP_029426761.1 borealin isoform X2 [Rhinatrema bivittatum]